MKPALLFSALFLFSKLTNGSCGTEVIEINPNPSLRLLPFFMLSETVSMHIHNESSFIQGSYEFRAIKSSDKTKISKCEIRVPVVLPKGLETQAVTLYFNDQELISEYHIHNLSLSHTINKFGDYNVVDYIFRCPVEKVLEKNKVIVYFNWLRF